MLLGIDYCSFPMTCHYWTKTLNEHKTNPEKKNQPPLILENGEQICHRYLCRKWCMEIDISEIHYTYKIFTMMWYNGWHKKKKTSKLISTEKHRKNMGCYYPQLGTIYHKYPYHMIDSLLMPSANHCLLFLIWVTYNAYVVTRIKNHFCPSLRLENQ